MRVLLLAILFSNLAADAQTGELLWSRANPSGAVPTPRIDAPIAYDAPGRQVLMFGGLDASGERNDLWSYSVDRQQWTQITPAGLPPNPRHGHTVTFDPVRRRIIIIAGQGAAFFGDAWAYDIQANLWTQVSSNLSGPSPRYGHSAIYDPKRDRVVLSHGFTSDQGRFDDTWAFDLASNSWRNISPAGTRPLRRCLHHAVYVPQSDQMLLYGGCSSGFGPCPQGDLWSFDLASNQWVEITSNPRPAPRQRYGMVFDDDRKKLVLFAGLGGPPLNDTWKYDPASVAWTQVTPGGDTPTPRYRIEAAFASDLGIAFFFGGQATNFSSDLLLLSASAPPAAIVAVSGNGQSGTVGATLPNPFVVAVQDARGNPVPSVAVNFAATNATVNPANTVTDSAGRASTMVTLGNTPGALTVTATVAGLASIAFSATAAAATSQITVGGVVNGASFSPNVAPGSIISLFGANLAATTSTASAIPLGASLAGTSVTINGEPAPLFFVSPQQINAQLPFEISPGPARAVVTAGGTSSAPFPFTVSPSAPGIFQFGTNRAVATNQDFTLNTSTNPAAAGSILVAFLTGQGGLNNPVATGAAASASPPSNPTLASTATIGGTNANVLFIGLTPGFVGLLQENLQVPLLPAGDYPLVITIGGVASNAAMVTLSAN